MKTNKSQKKRAKSQSGRKAPAKKGKGARQLSEASLDKVVGGVGMSRKRGGVADDSV
jgi:hypothetical protein